MIQYYVTNRSAFLQNPESNNNITVPASDPAYSLIKHFIQTNRLIDLKFFVDIGYRLNLNNISIESTRTRCFNIHTLNESYSTLPSMYESVMSKISSYEVDKNISIDDVISKIKDIIINANNFAWLGSKIRLTDNGLYAIGKYGEYFIDFNTNGVSLNKNFVCIHVNSNYTDPSLNEKELCLLTKTLACINDYIFFPNDFVLKKFVKEE